MLLLVVVVMVVVVVVVVVFLRTAPLRRLRALVARSLAPFILYTRRRHAPTRAATLAARARASAGRDSAPPLGQKILACAITFKLCTWPLSVVSISGTSTSPSS